MPGTLLVRRAARFSLLHGELTDRLQHAEPRLGRLGQLLHEALIHQFGDDVQCVGSRSGFVTCSIARGRRCRQRPPTGRTAT
jgi:hypothetical protein